MRARRPPWSCLPPRSTRCWRWPRSGVLRALFSTIGSYIIGLTVVALILIGRATFSFIEWVKRVERAVIALVDRASGWLRALLGAWSAAREIDRQKVEEERRAAEPRIA